MAESTKCIYITCTLLTTGTYVFMVNQKLLTEHCASLVNTASTEQGNEIDSTATKPLHLTCSMACKDEAPNCVCVGEELVTCFGSDSDIVETTTYPPSEDDGKHKIISLYVMCDRDFITNHYHDVYALL